MPQQAAQHVAQRLPPKPQKAPPLAAQAAWHALQVALRCRRQRAAQLQKKPQKAFAAGPSLQLAQPAGHSTSASLLSSVSSTFQPKAVSQHPQPSFQPCPSFSFE